jgi:hypothetical protein
MLRLMQPHLEQVFPPGSEYFGEDEAVIEVRLPLLPRFSYRKTATLSFDPDVIKAVSAAVRSGDGATVERLGETLADRLSVKFRQWGQNNVQLKMHVGLDALGGQSDASEP